MALTTRSFTPSDSALPCRCRRNFANGSTVPPALSSMSHLDRRSRLTEHLPPQYTRDFETYQRGPSGVFQQIKRRYLTDFQQPRTSESNLLFLRPRYLTSRPFGVLS